MKFLLNVIKKILYLQSTKSVKGKVSLPFDKNPEEIYLIKDCLQNEIFRSCGDYKSDTLNNSNPW